MPARSRLLWSHFIGRGKWGARLKKGFEIFTEGWFPEEQKPETLPTVQDSKNLMNHFWRTTGPIDSKAQEFHNRSLNGF